MEWIRRKLSRQPSPPPVIKRNPVVQRRIKKRPAPAPPEPNTRQLDASHADAPSYDPPTSLNLFKGYRYPDNMLNPWDDVTNTGNLPAPVSDVRKPFQSTTDPVAESKSAWAEYDKQFPRI